MHAVYGQLLCCNPLAMALEEFAHLEQIIGQTFLPFFKYLARHHQSVGNVDEEKFHAHVGGLGDAGG